MIAFLLALLLAQPPLVLDLPRGRAANEFRKVTGFPNGRKGYVVDHIIPLCAGGPDSLSNLQWQEVRASYRKDTFERALCVAMTKQNLRMVPR